MQLNFSSPKEKEKIRKSIYNLLSSNTLLTLATIDKKNSHASTAYYVYDKELNLYIWTGTNTQHIRNIKKNNRIAITIFDSTQEWGSLLQGLQASGKVIKVKDKELIKAGMLYIKRYPKVVKFAKKPKGFHKKVYESRIYKIQLEKIKLFDEKIFGKEEFKEIIIKR